MCHPDATYKKLGSCKMTQTYVSSQQRYNKYRPCPICGGHANLPQGKSERCAGFLSSDGKYAFCTREEQAGTLEPHKDIEPASYMHLLHGPCDCGIQHGAATSHTYYTKSKQKEDAYGRIVATYSYQDISGRLLYQSVRYDPKKFRQRRPDPSSKDGYSWDTQGVMLVPFHLPELFRAKLDTLIF